jgi:hypothetical protein
MLNFFKHERDIKVGSIAEESVKWKIMGKVRDALLCSGRKSIVLLQGPQASPISPFNTIRVKVKTLDWLEIVAWDRDCRILIFCINVELYNLEK